MSEVNEGDYSLNDSHRRYNTFTYLNNDTNNKQFFLFLTIDSRYDFFCHYNACTLNLI